MTAGGTIRQVTLRILGDRRGAQAALSWTNAEADKLEARKTTLHIGADTGKAMRDLAELRAAIDALKAKHDSVQINFADAASLAKAAQLKAAINALEIQHGKLAAANVTDAASLDRFNAALARQELAMHNLGIAAADFGKVQEKAVGGYKRFSAIQATGLGIMGAQVKLWGGLAHGTSVFTLALHGALEFTIALTGALIALTGGIVGLAGGAIDITHHLQALQMAGDGLNTHIKPLTANLHNLQVSLAPQALQLYGGAMMIAGRNTGFFSKLAHQASGIFVDWMANIDLWSQHQTTMNHLLNASTGFLAQFGHIFGQLLLAFDGMMKLDPGVSHVLGDIVGGFTTALHLFTELPAGIARTVLQIHAVYLWGGLAFTVLRKIANMGPFGGIEGGLTRVADKFGLINREAGTLAGLGKGQWLGLAALAVTIGFIAIKSQQATPDVQKLIDTVTQRIDTEQASTAIMDISTAIGQLQDKANSLSVASIGRNFTSLSGFIHNAGQITGYATQSFIQKIGKSANDVLSIFRGHVVSGFVNAFTAPFEHGSAATVAYSKDLEHLKASENQLIAQQGSLAKEAVSLARGQAAATVNTRMVTAGIMHQGSAAGAARVNTMNFAQALELMNLAGVKASDSFQLMQEKVKMLQQGYADMGVQQGILKNATNAATFGIEFQSSKVNQLVQGYQQFLSVVTGSSNSFVAFAQNIASIGQAMTGTTSRARSVTSTFNAAGTATKHVDTSFTGLNAKSLQLRSTWNQALQSGGQVITSLLNQSAAAGLGTRGYHLLTQAGKDLVSQLLQGARTSKQNQAQLYALAQEAGYHGADSFKSLSNWVQHSHASMSNLDHITTIFTRHSAALQTDVNNLAEAINKNLNQQMAQAIFLATGGTKWLNNFANAVLNSHGQINSLTPSAAKLAQQLIDNTHNTQMAHKEFDTFSMQLGLTKKQADNLWNSLFKLGKVHATPTVTETGTGQWSLSQGHQQSIQGAAGRRVIGAAGPAAHGLFVNQGTTPTADDVIARVSKGELVVPATYVSAGLVDHLRGMIPGFAQGGLIPSYKGGMPSMAPWSAHNVNALTNVMTTAMIAAMEAQQKKNANSVKMSFLHPTGAGATIEALMKSMAASIGWTGSMWNSLYNVEMAEAGFNLAAKNPSSGAYGLAQFINGPSEYFQYGGNPNTATGQITAFFNYIRQRYGNPERAWAHEQAFHWYAGGTAGAAPGWAWVGENGPELVKFHGGEIVHDAVTSALMGFRGRGYATGTPKVSQETLSGESLIKQFWVSNETISSLVKNLAHFTREIDAYLHGAERRWARDMVRRQVHAMESIDNRLKNAQAQAAAAVTAKKAVQSALSGYGDLSNLTLGPTPGIGDNVPLAGGQGLSMQLGQKVGTLRKFMSVLKQLEKEGLPSALLQQVAEMDPATGIQYAQELLQGGPKFIRRIAGQEKTIASIEGQIGRGVGATAGGATAWHGSMASFWKFDKNLTSGLEAEFKRLGRILGEEAGKWFHVPRAKRPHARGGVVTEPVFGTGLYSGDSYSFAEYEDEAFIPQSAMNRIGHGRGGDVYNITVAGDTDPDGAAYRIIQKIRDYKRHHGYQATGIG